MASLSKKEETMRIFHQSQQCEYLRVAVDGFSPLFGLVKLIALRLGLLTLDGITILEVARLF